VTGALDARAKGIMDMVELRYFTGTGNSRRMLDACRQVFAAGGRRTRLLSMTNAAGLDPETKLLGIGFPVYSLGAPRIVRNYLQSLPVLSERRQAFVLASIGGRNEEGWALQECRDLLSARGYDVFFSDAVLMPDNWMPMAYVPTPEEALRILERAETRLAGIAEKLMAGEGWHKPFVFPKFGPLGSRIIHHLFHKRGIHKLWKLFKATPACTGCGTCSRQCPLHAINMTGERPEWSAACEQCMRCMNTCPRRAIQQLEWIGHGSRRNQYREPHFNPALEV
jgi:ferredoxin